MNENHYSFLTVGKTAESSNGSSAGFKRYVGIGSSYVLAVNPDKKKRDELLGYESQEEPKYVVEGENGKEAKVTFIVRTDPEASCNNGIELTIPVVYTIRNTPVYNNDKSLVQVIDKYGNSSWANTEDVKAKKTLPGNLKIDHNNYRMAAYGEADLIAFLKQYLCVPGSLDYKDGEWVISDSADEGKFEFGNMKNFFNGDFSEVKQAIGMQPHNKVKLLYGVTTTEGEKGPRQFQTVAIRGNLILRNGAGSKAYAKIEEELSRLKGLGSYPNTEFRVGDLQEWNVEATDFKADSSDSDSVDSLWD